MTHNQKSSMIWTMAITSTALFMVSLDNRVVTTALPVIRRDLHATISQLEWTVNAYTLTFAVLLLTGAALGDRFGRRRMFALGLLLFTGASAAAAMSTSADALDITRALQGVGAAIVTPLTLTILSAAVPRERRGLALGIWGGIGGLAIAIGPLVGGANVNGVSWHWIFWLNVPIGLVLAPLALARLEETRGTDSSLDLPIVAGVALVAAFVGWELRTESPMLPMHFFRSRAFALTNAASLLMFFGMFGSIFLLTQFFQTVQHFSPLQSGLRILPWTAMPIFVAPIAGALSDRIGGQRFMTVGLALQATGLAWIAAVSSPTVSYSSLVLPFILAGTGMAFFFAPVANVVLSSVRPEHEGKASGANNAIREVGGVLGVAVLASIFAHAGGYQSAHTFSHGTNSAVFVGAAVVAAGSLAAALIRGRRTQTAPQTQKTQTASEEALEAAA